VRHCIVVDLGYGDAGKGTVVDWLCSRGGEEPVHAVVRFNGGAQAAHNVVSADGRHHTFAQFGSGTFVPGVRTHLSRFMLVDPLALAAEAAHLTAIGVPDVLGRLTVDREALLTTPYHAAANRARELARGAGRHGSCGMGIGETASYALAHAAGAPRAGDTAAPATLTRKLAELADRLAAEVGPLHAPPVADVVGAYRQFGERVRLVDGGYLGQLLRAGPVVFEGAQGVLLDEWHGFHPYTTWSTTTFANAETLLAEAGHDATGHSATGHSATGHSATRIGATRIGATRIGVIRCYQTRHGPGPFVTEDPTLELPEPHNAAGRWQGEVRTGHFDAVALRYALAVTGGADALALTHVDTAAQHPELRICRSYQVDGAAIAHLPAGPAGDLGGARALTSRLLRASPVYDRAGPGRDWPAAVASALGVPVAVTSRGPRVIDKRLTADGAALFRSRSSRTRRFAAQVQVR
jgi:adenylosuccinate synthase